MTTWGILVAFAHAVSWGATSVLLRRLSLRLDVFVLNGLRACWAAVVVAWFLAAGAPGGATLTSGKMLVIVASIVVGGLLGDTCNVVALRLVGVSRAVPLTSSFPVFTVLFAFLLWGDTPSPLAILGALLVVGGAALLSASERDPGPAQPREGGSAVRVEVARRHRSLGLLLAAATAAAWGLETVLTANRRRGHDHPGRERRARAGRRAPLAHRRAAAPGCLRRRPEGAPQPQHDVVAHRGEPAGLGGGRHAVRGVDQAGRRNAHGHHRRHGTALRRASERTAAAGTAESADRRGHAAGGGRRDPGDRRLTTVRRLKAGRPARGFSLRVACGPACGTARRSPDGRRR